jgi:putative DNA primase/helicase
MSSFENIADFKQAMSANQTWCSKQASEFNAAEREAWIEQQAEITAKVKAEKLAKQAEAAKKAIRLWSEARPDVDLKHTYLLAKGNIYPHGVKQLGQALLIPVYGQDKQLDGCQFIYGDGSKKFLTGTKKQGSFCYLKPANYQPNDTQMIYITEGWSTGVSVFMAMNNLVLVAFDKGNLKTVAMF